MAQRMAIRIASLTARYRKDSVIVAGSAKGEFDQNTAIGRVTEEGTGSAGCIKMMNRRRCLSAVLFAAAAVLFATGAHAQAPDKLADCRQTKDLDRAIAACTEIIDAGTRDAQIYISRGVALVLRNDVDRAARDFDEAVKLDPKNPEAFDRRGFVYHARGDDDRAITDFTKALKLGSTDLQVYVDRGMAQFAKGDYAKAIADFTTVVDRDGGKTFDGQLALVVRGLTRVYSGAPDKAQVDLKRAYELNPKDPFFAIFLYLAERRTGAPGSLAAAAAAYDPTRWPTPAIQMFLHTGSVEAVLATKGNPITVCEADYLAAEFMQLESRKQEAIRHYRKADTDCPRHILEGIAARAALRLLGVSR
jgi:lipoprotein NlpI